MWSALPSDAAWCSESSATSMASSRLSARSSGSSGARRRPSSDARAVEESIGEPGSVGDASPAGGAAPRSAEGGPAESAPGVGQRPGLDGVGDHPHPFVDDVVDQGLKGLVGDDVAEVADDHLQRHEVEVGRLLGGVVARRVQRRLQGPGPSIRRRSLDPAGVLDEHRRHPDDGGPRSQRARATATGRAPPRRRAPAPGPPRAPPG